MAKLYYYNETGEKVGVSSTEELQTLAAQGIITPQTTTETAAGRKRLAKEIKGKNGKGLTFAKTVQSEPSIDWTTPRDILAREAEKNNPEAFLYIALHYAHGTNGFVENEAAKIDFYQKGAALADQGSPAALYCGAVCCLTGYGVDKDEKEAVGVFRNLAEQGYAQAQKALSGCYTHGMGVAINQSEAFKWAQKAAEQGEPGSQCLLGAFYQHGMGVAQDIQEAVNWYSKAAVQGEKGAQQALDHINAAAAKTMYKHWLEDAENGDSQAMFFLALYYYGNKGVEPNKEEEMKWYQKAAVQGHETAQQVLDQMTVGKNSFGRYLEAAERGNAEAQFRLAGCYSQGFGVEQNDAESARWLLHAAEQGHAEAQYELGACYAEGIGVEKDSAEALKWLQKSAKLGNKDALQWFQAAAKDGFEPAIRILDALKRGVEYETEPFLRVLERAEQGDADAQCIIGGYYLEGIGDVEQDTEEAVKWFRKAAEQGHAEGQYELGIFYRHGEGVPKDANEAVN